MISFTEFMLGCSSFFVMGAIVGFWMQGRKNRELWFFNNELQAQVVYLEEAIKRYQRPVMPFKWDKTRGVVE